jgi:hypothetical protein
MVFARGGRLRLRRAKAANIRFQGVGSAARADFPTKGERQFRDGPAAGVALWVGMIKDA